jgi:tetratricopeptide (TPR) repeat protein
LRSGLYVPYSYVLGGQILDSALRHLLELGAWKQLIVALNDAKLDQKNDPELWYLLGKAHRELGQAELGFDAFAKALQLDPLTPSLRLEAVEALLTCQEWDLARQLLLQPAGLAAAQLPVGRWALARCHSRLDEPNKAETDLLDLQAAGGLDLERLGVGLSECNLLLGDLDRARFCLDRLLELVPNYVDGLLLELELLRAKPSADFAGSVHAVLQRSPSSRRLQIACAEALFDWKEPAQAEDLYQVAIQQHRLTGRLVNSYVRTLVSTYRLDDLRQVRQQCIAPYPQLNFEVLEAKCLMGLNRTSEARTALEAMPMQFATAYLLSKIYRHSGQFNRALDLASELPRLAGLDPDCGYDAAVELLALGQWQQGWKLYENRFFGKSKRFITPAGIEPRSSQDLPDAQQVIVFSEQGIGDSIMMASMLPDLQLVAADLTVLVQPRLESLFIHSFPDLRICSSIDETIYRSADRCYGLGSLGQFFRPTPTSCPGTPFLMVPEQEASRWAQQLQCLPVGRRIGVAWFGGGQVETAQHRSIPLIELLPLFQVEGLTWVNLQYNHDPVELDQLASDHGVRIHHFEGITADLLATAALTAQLDLVITVQQTAAHIAGAIGTPAWVLLPQAPEWRYGMEGSQMPWYDSVELYRQSSPGDWSVPIKAIQSRLRSWLAEPASQNDA